MDGDRGKVEGIRVDLLGLPLNNSNIIKQKASVDFSNFRRYLRKTTLKATQIFFLITSQRLQGRLLSSRSTQAPPHGFSEPRFRDLLPPTSDPF